MLKVLETGLFTSDLAKQINLFTGAGFSTQAKNGSNEFLPLGDKLKADLVNAFDIENYASLDLASLYAVLQTDRKEELRNYLKRTFIITTDSTTRSDR